MLGFLLIDKPSGWSSHDAVAKVRTRLKTRRVGHSGTLDPLATGLLVVAVGHATRFLNYLDLEPKVYQVEASFGYSTTTYDLEGETVARGEPPVDLVGALASAFPSFHGQILQKPPAHSAVKIEGKKLYEYARNGHSIDLPDREVSIDCIKLKGIEGHVASLEVTCGGGTFVRSLVHDLGEAIGCPAHVSGLRRVRMGRFDVRDAVFPADSSEGDLQSLPSCLPGLPRLEVAESAEADLRNGLPIYATETQGPVLILNRHKAVVCLALGVGNQLKPKIVIPNGDSDPDIASRS